MCLLARWSNELAFLGRLKVLLESILKGWLTESLGAPSLELNVFGIVQAKRTDEFEIRRPSHQRIGRREDPDGIPHLAHLPL